DETVVVPGVEPPQTEFADPVEPVRLALAQEKTVTEQIVALAKLAREEGDLVGEQFLAWFLQEQREEVASLATLLGVVERATGVTLPPAEEPFARTAGGEGAAPAVPAPPAAGGEL